MSTPDANGGGSDDAGSGAGDPTPAEGRPAGTIADVTDVLARGPLQIQVQRAEQAETVEVFGFSRPPEAGLAAFEVTIAFKNAAAAYVSFVTDSFGMLADDAVVADASSFAALTSRSFGGVALAPGELRVYDLVYEAPDGAGRYGVGGSFNVRTLPGAAFESVGRVVVDFANDPSGEPLAQSLSVPFREFGESVAVGGLEATVREAFVRDEVAGQAAPDGSAFAVIDVAGTNGSQLPVAFGVGGGGFALRDDAGRSYTNTGGPAGDASTAARSSGCRTGPRPGSPPPDSRWPSSPPTRRRCTSATPSRRCCGSGRTTSPSTRSSGRSGSRTRRVRPSVFGPATAR